MTLSENKKSCNIILEKVIKEEIDRIAEMEDRSSSNLINFVLKKFIDDYHKSKNSS